MKPDRELPFKEVAPPALRKPDCGLKFKEEVPSSSPREPDCGRKFKDEVPSSSPREPDCVVIDREEAAPALVTKGPATPEEDLFDVATIGPLLAVLPPRCLLTNVVASSDTIEMFSSSENSVVAVSSLLDLGLRLGPFSDAHNLLMQNFEAL